MFIDEHFLKNDDVHVSDFIPKNPFYKTFSDLYDAIHLDYGGKRSIQQIIDISERQIFPCKDPEHIKSLCSVVKAINMNLYIV